MVDDTCGIVLILQGIRKAKQDIAAIRLAAGEGGCPIGDASGFAGAI